MTFNCHLKFNFLTHLKGKRDADGNIVLTIDGDFTKCGTRVEAITETFTEADGTESQRVKEYVVSTIFAANDRIWAKMC